MNEHENDGKKENKGAHCSMKHMLMMVLCCGLPILLIIALPFLKIGSTGFRVTLASIIPFLFPVMMLFMIPMMLKGSKEGKSCHDNKEKQLKSWLKGEQSTIVLLSIIQSQLWLLWAKLIHMLLQYP